MNKKFVPRHIGKVFVDRCESEFVCQDNDGSCIRLRPLTHRYISSKRSRSTLHPWGRGEAKVGEE